MDPILRLNDGRESRIGIRGGVKKISNSIFEKFFFENRKEKTSKSIGIIKILVYHKHENIFPKFSLVSEFLLKMNFPKNYGEKIFGNHKVFISEKIYIFKEILKS